MLQFVCRLGLVLSTLGAGLSEGGGGANGGWAWLGTGVPQGNERHSTNKTLQTMQMKCPGSCGLYVFFFLVLPPVQSCAPC